MTYFNVKIQYYLKTCLCLTWRNAMLYYTCNRKNFSMARTPHIETGVAFENYLTLRKVTIKVNVTLLCFIQ